MAFKFVSDYNICKFQKLPSGTGNCILSKTSGFQANMWIKPFLFQENMLRYLLLPSTSLFLAVISIHVLFRNNPYFFICASLFFHCFCRTPIKQDSTVNFWDCLLLKYNCSFALYISSAHFGCLSCTCPTRVSSWSTSGNFLLCQVGGNFGNVSAPQYLIWHVYPLCTCWHVSLLYPLLPTPLSWNFLTPYHVLSLHCTWQHVLDAWFRYFLWYDMTDAKWDL